MIDKFIILFPCDPFDRKSIDIDFHEEANTCTILGIKWYLFDHDEFVSSEKFITNLPIESSGDTVILRSWMLKPEQYQSLLGELFTRSFKVLNSTFEYTNCHYLPNSYKHIITYTPQAIWFYDIANKSNAILCRKSIDGDVIIKDFVKSEKGNPDLFILSKDLSDDEYWSRVNKFIEVRGKLFNEGIVLKKIVSLKKYKEEKTNEWRVFVANKNIISCKNNSNLQDIEAPNTSFLNSIIDNIQSTFFTIDIAEKEDGEWTILETGDGQVSGLATGENVLEFYTNLKEALCQQLA